MVQVGRIGHNLLTLASLLLILLIGYFGNYFVIPRSKPDLVPLPQLH